MYLWPNLTETTIQSSLNNQTQSQPLHFFLAECLNRPRPVFESRVLNLKRLIQNSYSDDEAAC